MSDCIVKDPISTLAECGFAKPARQRKSPKGPWIGEIGHFIIVDTIREQTWIYRKAMLIA